MSVHAGDIPIDQVAAQLAEYLTGFEKIVDLYRHWMEIRLGGRDVPEVFATLPKRSAAAILQAIGPGSAPTVYSAYNAATWHATHAMRSHRTAFELLGRVNRAFQGRWPLQEV